MNKRHKIKFGEKTTFVTWIPCNESDLKKFTPITQAYGICLDDNKNVLIIKGDPKWGWALPGGTPEPGETLRETLVRELQEEADVTVKDISFLGLQKVENKEKILYQSRWLAKIDSVLPQTVDPAKGVILKRKFVPFKDLRNWVKWGGAFEDMLLGLNK